MKFDNTNSLKTPKPRSNGQKTNGKVNSHVVGVRIDTRSNKTKNKIYYYTTTENYKRGDVIRVHVPSGGSPKSTIAVENSSKGTKYRIKELKEVK